MTTSSTTTQSGSFSIGHVLGVAVGALVFAYGLLLVPASVLGGLWIAAIGASLVLAILFATEWAGDRWGISPADRRTLSLSFGIIAVVLLASFVVVNYAGVSGPNVETGSETGSGLLAR